MMRQASSWTPVKVAAALALVALVFGVVHARDATPIASAATTTVQVGQQNGGSTSANQFNAASISAVAGDTVRFVRFAGTHNVVSSVVPAGAVLSCNAAVGTCTNTAFQFPPTAVAAGDPIVAGTNYDLVFGAASAPGTYTYYCNIHAGANDATLANVDSSIAGGKMVGKIVVSAPVTDDQAPTVSGVGASPNPTLGAAAVTLNATVNDTAPVGATAQVAGAEWSKGAAAAAAGSGTAMAASDGAFNSASEGVSANVPIVEAPGSSVTLWVRGRDATGNWGAAVSTVVSVTAPPAGSVQATISVNSGNLSNTAQNVAFPSVTLNGTDQTMTGTTSAWNATDARGTGAGWNVTIAASNFTSSGGGSIDVANFKCQLLQANVITLSGGTAPTTAMATLVPLSGTPAKMLSAALSAGMGSYNYTPDFQLIVPGSTLAGSYTANVTVSINSGP